MPKVEPPATVAVTGASGFVGSHVVRELLQRGYDVRAVVTDPTNEAKVEHLRRMGGKLTLRRGDLMTPGSYDEAFRGCEGIVHCAARVHEARQGAELLPSHLEGTNNVLASAMKAGSVKRFVHTSSEAAVFDPFKLQSSEAVVFSEADWSDACTPDVGGFYATGKREAERAVKACAARADVSFDSVALCPSVVLGECLCKAHSKASPVFVRQLLFGNQQEDVNFHFVDAADVAFAHAEALCREEAAEGPARFIVSLETCPNLAGVAAKISELYPGLKADAVHPSWAARQLRWFATTHYEWAALNMAPCTLDAARSRAVLGVQYADLETTLRRTVDSMRPFVRVRERG